MLLQIQQHFVEVGSTTRLGGFNIGELLRNHQASVRGVISQETELRWDAEAFLLLILARHPGVQHHLDSTRRRPVLGGWRQCQSPGWHTSKPLLIWTKRHREDRIDRNMAEFLYPQHYHLRTRSSSWRRRMCMNSSRRVRTFPFCVREDNPVRNQAAFGKISTGTGGLPFFRSVPRWSHPRRISTNANTF